MTMPGLYGALGRTADIGRWMLWLGCLGMLWGLLLTPPWGKIGFAVALVGALLARAPLHRMPVAWIGLALGLWVVVSTLAAVLAGQPGAGRLSGIAYAWLAVPLVAAAAAEVRWSRFALRGLLVVGGLAVAVGVAQFTIGLGSGPFRIDPDGTRLIFARGFSSYHLSFGFAVSVLAALSVPVLTGPGWAWAGRIIALIGLVVCGARAAVVGGTAAIAAALAARGRRWLLAAALVALVIGAALVGRLALNDNGRLQRMLAGEDGRWPIWHATAAMIVEHPLLGVGGRPAYQQAYNEVYERTLPGVANEFGPEGGSPHAHNWLLAVASEHGLPAALLHMLLVLAVVATLWRRRYEAPAAFQAGCGIAVAGLVCGMFEPLPAQAAAGMGFHAALGLALGLGLAAKPQIPPSTSA